MTSSDIRPMHVIYTYVVQRPNDDGTWTDVPSPQKLASGKTPLDAAQSVLYSHTDYKGYRADVVAALANHRIVLTPPAYERDLVQVVVTVAEIYMADLVRVVDEYVEKRDSLPALRKAAEQARRAYQEARDSVKHVGPYNIQDRARLAALAGADPEAIAAASRIPPVPRTRTKKA